MKAIILHDSDRLKPSPSIEQLRAPCTAAIQSSKLWIAAAAVAAGTLRDDATHTLFACCLRFFDSDEIHFSSSKDSKLALTGLFLKSSKPTDSSKMSGPCQKIKQRGFRDV
jgi:hypothetical protein